MTHAPAFIRAIREGKAIAKILDSPTADQVFVFGSVYINSTPERYLKFASDIERSANFK